MTTLTDTSTPAAPNTLPAHETTARCGPMPYLRDSTLHEAFDAQAALRPRALAGFRAHRGDGDGDGERLTYGAAKDRSDALAARLRSAGVRRGDTVGVCGSRSLDALTAYLGVLKAGAAYVPLDDATPPGRLQAMAEEARVHTLLVLPGSTGRIRRVRTRITLNGLPEPARSDHPQTPHVPADNGHGSDCASIMFTSGTTGRPKPVAIPHRGVARLAASDAVCQRPRPGDRVLHAYDLSSDASTIEIWSPLLNGACVVLIDREELLSPAALEHRLREDRVSIAYLTTGVFHHVARTKPEALRTLRFVSAGGEAMDPELAGAVLEACPDTAVVNFYGPTENSVVSTAHLLRRTPAPGQPVPIGRPLEESSCHVLRPDGSPAGVGEEGDLLVGGDGLALGYPGDPELTAERFVDAPSVPGGRLYRTGDRALWRPDGELEYRARADRQIKLRGHRIELDEVEARLRAHESIGEAVVMREGDTLTAHLTPAEPGHPVPLDRVRTDLAAWLPAAAVPARLTEIERFPLTSAGKVDRKALRKTAAAEQQSPETRHPNPAALDDLRESLADVWHTVLHMHPQDDDDFFDLGGDSLLAAETVTRTLTALHLDARHGSTLVHSLLREPTLRGYTTAVAALQKDGRATTTRTAEIDFEAEARLGFTLPPPRPDTPRRPPRDVLLTGASGFVGAFLLHRLLQTTDARIHCPVRSRDEAHARRRVTAALFRYGLAADTADALSERVVCLPADLNEPALGLEPARATELSDKTDLILHAAAQVNFLYPYQALRQTNVEATRQLVRLAAPRRVPLHFLSTIAVLAGFGTAGVRHVEEDRPLAHPDRLTMGYAESKWVAEQLLQNAAREGLPVTVHRPYEITGDRETGACNTETAICSLFRTIAETGLAPDIPLPMDFVPVDYLADAIVRLATEQPATGRTYHLTNPHPATLHHMLDRMRAAGHPIRMLPYDEWVGELVRHVTRHPTSPTAPFVSLCVDRGNKVRMSVKEMFFEGTFPAFAWDNVERDLAGSPPCPPVDESLLDHYLEYFYETGYLERPKPAR